MSDRSLDRLVEALDEADAAVALTGAGISAPSGVPTFRGEDGVWDHFDQGQFAYGRFRRDPAAFWADRIDLHAELYGDEPPEPNAAHRALATLEAEGVLDAVVTQNVDGLHADAARESADGRDDQGGTGGGDSVLELHGNARRVACTECGRRQATGPVVDRVRDGERPPRCDCGGLLKPDVVLFGEQLPAGTLQRARTLAREADVFLAIGSSLVVQPAASLPRIAAADGATVGVVNLESTPVDDAASVVCRADVTDVLPALAESVLTASD